MWLERKTAFVWSVSIAIFAIGASAADVSFPSEDQNSIENSTGGTTTTREPDKSSAVSSIAETTVKEYNVSSGKELLTVNCLDIRVPCRNGGKCVNGRCQCLSGTHGDLCEIVDGCLDPFGQPKCGAVPCVFNQTSKQPYCRCEDPDDLFDGYEKKCKECNCGIHGSCFFLDGEKTCQCKEGYAVKPGGQFNKSQCERCDCGPNGACSFNERSAKVCSCQNGYVDVKGYCVRCDCGPNGNCGFDEEGKKVCYCKKGYADSKGYCADCACGGNNEGCQFLPGGGKSCYCNPPYSQKDGKCQKCDCGKNSNGCSFEHDQKICSCETNYIQSNGTCKRDCMWQQTINLCNNGGKCVSGICQCVFGTHGDLCEVVDGCLDNFGQPKCGVVPCVFNQTSKQPYCRCEDPDDLFDGYDKTCKECDCGSHGSCFFMDGKKTCNCEAGYVVKPAGPYSKSQCELCECGPHGVCSFLDGGQKVCNCQNGYLSRYGYCYECDCGPNGFCSFLSDGGKMCACRKGYINKKGYCTQCDCGRNGVCSLPGDGKKKFCDCIRGYSDNKGYCEECNCGPNGVCSFDENGVKRCNCEKRYSAKNGYCYECDCGSFGECELNYNDEKTCNCREGYGERNGKCTGCECYWEHKNVSCTFPNGKQKCTCPDGYEESKKNFCLDIDECKDASICPITTDCINTPGSYKCSCKRGYEPLSGEHDLKRHGCKAIPEEIGMNVVYIVLIIAVAVIFLGLKIIVLYRRSRYTSTSRVWSCFYSRTS